AVEFSRCGRFLRSCSQALRALPAFPTLSDLSDPISSVLSGPEFLFLRGLPALSDFIRIISGRLIGGFS
ncbi:hypothetical protein, partial [Streptomyces hydrogenans]|uniref:hypothetical protein n=1 Tax=Streptomyces hydrogenans TaxID=1873719 RepID=UPI00331F6D80